MKNTGLALAILLGLTLAQFGCQPSEQDRPIGFITHYTPQEKRYMEADEWQFHQGTIHFKERRTQKWFTISGNYRFTIGTIKDSLYEKDRQHPSR